VVLPAPFGPITTQRSDESATKLSELRTGLPDRTTLTF